MYTKTFVSLSAIVLLTSGCSLAPKVQKDPLKLPQNSLHVKTQTVESIWWKKFHDKNLDALIAEALKNSDDLKLSLSNLKKARAAYGLDEAALYPQLDLDGTATRQQKSLNSFPSSYGGIYNNFGTFANVSYEIDFWGAVGNQRDADLALFFASKANMDSMRIAIITDVANYYFTLLALDEQLRIAQTSVQSYTQSLQYREIQLKHGVIDPLVIAQAKAQVADATRTVETLKQSRLTTYSALALLLGRSPAELFESKVITAKALPASVHIPAGVPANLLENRPDIRSAEQNLIAKTDLIGVAKAAYFPNISLTGDYGFQSQKLDNLVSSSSTAWGFGPSLSIPLFHFGALKAALDMSKADQKSALISYDKVVKNAYKEIYDALGSMKISQERCVTLAQEVAAYNDAYALADKKFARGTVSHLEVLDAQKGVLSAKLAEVDAKKQLLLDEVSVYKALGGGWKSHYKKQKTQSN